MVQISISFIITLHFEHFEHFEHSDHFEQFTLKSAFVILNLVGELLGRWL